MMTVKGLINALRDIHEDLSVVLQSDEEGNGYSRLFFVEPAKFNTYYETVVHPDDVDSHDPEDLEDVVVLGP